MEIRIDFITSTLKKHKVSRSLQREEKEFRVSGFPLNRLPKLKVLSSPLESLSSPRFKGLQQSHLEKKDVSLVMEKEE